MKRILLSLVTLALVGLAVTGATTAIFSDEETSTGNTFTAGAIDLTIDNESYYNGVLNASTTWLQPADLDDGNGPSGDGAYLFFSFDDLKPGDWGEDTISIHVNNNESWVCADVTLTSNEDNGSNEPELNDENPYTDGPGEGELADGVTFIWWADDGDNVLEDDETVLNEGTLGQLGVGNTATVPLADSQVNIWGDIGGLPGDSVRYVGKAWCFGDMTIAPEAQDGSGTTTNPTIAQGFSCSGAPVNNETQTDSMTADISFRAVQSRNNGEFLCVPPDPVTTLTVHKIVDNEFGGTATEASWTYTVDGGVGDVTHNVATVVDPGTYNVSESNGPAGYALSFGEGCPGGEITVSEGEQATCFLINTFNPSVGNLTVTKDVVGTTTAVSEFSLFVGGVAATSGVGADYGIGTSTVTETFDASLDNLFTTTFGGECDANGDVVITEDGTHSCTITNTYDPGDITIDKSVQFTGGGVAIQIENFELFIDDGVNGPIELVDVVTMTDLPAGTYTVSENYVGPFDITFDAQFSGDCSDDGQTGTIVLGNGDSASCDLLNVITVNNT